MNAAPFPLAIRLSARKIEELRECELGAYEDDEAKVEKGEEPDRALESHTYTVCKRATGAVLSIADADEAEDVYYAVCSGTFQLHHLSAARQIADLLRPYALPETVKLWPRPEGL